MNDEIPQIIKDLATAVSTAVKVQNRHWLALGLTSLFVLVPQSAKTPSDGLPLPLGLPSVDASWFALVAVLVLSVLTIAFAAAQSRAVRTANFAHRIMEERDSSAHLVAGHHERDYFDALREPSLGQVASLAQVVRGQHQFHADKHKNPKWRVSLSKSAYLFFKVPSLVVWLALPIAAEFYALSRYLSVGPPASLGALPTVIVWFMAGSAALALAVAAWLELEYIWRVLRRS